MNKEYTWLNLDKFTLGDMDKITEGCDITFEKFLEILFQLKKFAYTEEQVKKQLKIK
ncbi:MAG: hypothetical protein GY861_18245 [bacterium]|nr:hypothetical protein [bacterium]